MVSGNFQVASNKILARHNTTEVRRLGTNALSCVQTRVTLANTDTRTFANITVPKTEENREKGEKKTQQRKKKEERNKCISMI